MLTHNLRSTVHFHRWK